MKKLILLFTAILTVLLLASTVYAADITLSSSCSLADAIIAANHDRPEGGCPAGRGADAITLTRDITLDGGLPKITSAIAIEGKGYTISGDHRWRIFYNEGGDLTIKDLTMTKGYVEGEFIRNEDGTAKATADQPFGGAIANWQGTVAISDSTFSDNLAERFGGAIFNAGKLGISGSSFSDNWAESFGGAITNWEEGELSISDSAFRGNSAGFGGAIYNSAEELSISGSSFSDNWADNGGAISNSEELSISGSNFSDNWAESFGGAITNWEETLSISDSTFSNNSAEWGGGAITNWEEGELSISSSSLSRNSAYRGGAINNEGELSITSSTFSGNSAADKGGAVANWENGELSIVNGTFSDNSADKGGSIFNGENGKLRMRNSIIAGIGGACYYESRLRGNINNFIQDGSCSSDFEGDPMLGELVVPKDGSPAYFPLLAGSPAIDAAGDGYCPETDQIGTVRPQGGGCDIGAIEYKD